MKRFPSIKETTESCEFAEPRKGDRLEIEEFGFGIYFVL